MPDVDRSTVVKGAAAAWGAAVIAVAVGTPAHAASTVVPPEPDVTCEPDGKHRWKITFPDFSSVTVDQDVAMSHPVWGPKCRAWGSNPGAGK